MLFEERFNEFQIEKAIRAGHELVKSQIWTALPCKIVSYNATEQSCKLQPLIQGKLRQTDTAGNTTYKDFDYPQIVDVPVNFTHGGGLSMTFPINAGDEGIVLFASRCLDNWWLPPNNAQAGMPQPQGEMRMHDWNDAFFIPGVRSKPNWLKNVSTNSVQLRSDDGKTYLELTSSSNGVLNIVAPGGVNITAPFVSVVAGGSGTGEVRAAGQVTAKYGGGSSVTLTGHTHTDPSEGNTGGPNPGT